MLKNKKLKPPFFEIGLKGYMYGRQAVELAVAADEISREFNVPIIFDPQHVDIPACAAATEDLLVFAQHLDPIEVGRGNGKVLAEAVKEAGARGTMLNHVEMRASFSDLSQTIQRCEEIGLMSLVCVDSPQEAAAIAQLAPDFILAEPPELIGTGESVGKIMSHFVADAVSAAKAVNPDIIVFASAGIRTPDDVAEIIRLGADATGTTSGIVKADDPVAQTRAMVKALRETWDEVHGTN